MMAAPVPPVEVLTVMVRLPVVVVIVAPRWLPNWVVRANGLAGMLAFSLFANRIRLDDVDADDLVLGLG